MAEPHGRAMACGSEILPAPAWTGANAREFVSSNFTTTVDRVFALFPYENRTGFGLTFVDMS